MIWGENPTVFGNTHILFSLQLIYSSNHFSIHPMYIPLLSLESLEGNGPPHPSRKNMGPATLQCIVELIKRTHLKWATNSASERISYQLPSLNLVTWQLPSYHQVVWMGFKYVRNLTQKNHTQNGESWVFDEWILGFWWWILGFWPFKNKPKRFLLTVLTRWS